MPISTILLLILAFIAALSVAVFQYFLFEKSRVKITIVLAFLRFLTVFSILILIINPKIKNQSTENEKPILNIVVDNSSSLKDYKDNIGIILNELTVNKKLVDKFDIISYQFGNQFSKLDSLSFADVQTNIINPISQLNKVYKNNIAPIILVTDGNQNIGNSYEYYNSTQSIFPVIIGDTTNYVDVKISNINVNKYAFLNNKFPVEIVVNYDGNRPINSNITIYKGSNSVVFKKQLKLSSINSSEIIQLFLPANKIGLNNYTAVVTSINNEKNTTNNRFRFSLEVIDQQSKILIVSSILHPDLGMFKKSIETNKQRKVDIKLINDKNIQLLEYQVIIVYQPNNKFNVLFNDLKLKSKNYFVISGSKTDWNFLNSIQSYYSKNAINEIENYLPKYNDNFTLFVNNDLGFSNFPPLEDSFGELKFLFPSDVLLYQNSPIKELSIPLLALFNDKEVKTGILLGENSWRWRMHSYQEKQSFEPFDNYFGNIINYLTTDKKSGRLEVEAKNNYFENQPIHISAYFYDETYQFNPNAQLSIKVFDNQNKEVLNQPFKLAENYFETNLSGLKSGDYTYKVTSKSEKAISSSGGFYIEDFNIEQLFTKPDVVKLTTLASNSKGQVYYLNQSDLLIESLINNDDFTTLQKVTTSYQSLINWKWLLGAIILFLSTEWFIRKYHGYI